MRLVHESRWMTAHEEGEYAYRYVCGAAFLGAGEGRERTVHVNGASGRVTCEACRHAVQVAESEGR